MTTGAAITTIVERLADRPAGEWVRLEQVAEGLAKEEIQEAIEELAQDGSLEITEQPLGWRITEWDCQNAPMIGGERVHLIRWAWLA
jgi:hypothetical protein